MDETRSTIYRMLDDARNDLLAAIQGVPAEAMTLPVIGDWTCKDLLNHVAYWEEIALPDLRRVARGDTPALVSFDHTAIDVWNQLVMSMRKEFSLQQTMRELDEMRHGMKSLLEQIPDAQFTSGWVPSCCAISAHHDREHASQIREWRRRALP